MSIYSITEIVIAIYLIMMLVAMIFIIPMMFSASDMSEDEDRALGDRIIKNLANA